MRYKIDFLGRFDRFSPDFFWKSGEDRLSMADLSILGSGFISLLSNKQFLFHGSWIIDQ